MRQWLGLSLVVLIVTLPIAIGCGKKETPNLAAVESTAAKGPSGISANKGVRPAPAPPASIN